MGSGALNDRRFYLEVNKPLRLSGTSYIKPGGPQLWDDFIGDTLDANLWSSVADTGGTAAAVAVAAGGGHATIITSGTDDHRTDLANEVIWTPSLGGLFFETRLKVSNATCAINAGFSDAKSEATSTIGITATGANVMTTTATDAVLWVWDSDLTTDKWLGQGVDTNVDATTVVGPTTDPTAWTTLAIEITSAGIAHFYHNGLFYGAASAATTPSVAHVPYIALQNRAASARTLTIDYVFAASFGRATS